MAVVQDFVYNVVAVDLVLSLLLVYHQDDSVHTCQPVAYLDHDNVHTVDLVVDTYVPLVVVHRVAVDVLAVYLPYDDVASADDCMDSYAYHHQAYHSLLVALGVVHFHYHLSQNFVAIYLLAVEAVPIVVVDFVVRSYLVAVHYYTNYLTHSYCSSPYCFHSVDNSCLTHHS